MYAIWIWRRGQYDNGSLVSSSFPSGDRDSLRRHRGLDRPAQGEWFLAVAKTRGNDIDHLMAAFRQLDKVWMVIAGFVEALIYHLADSPVQPDSRLDGARRR